MADYLPLVRMSILRRFLLIVAAGAYAAFLVRAALPTLSMYYDFTAYLFMGACALIATVCARGSERWFTSIALVFAVAASIYAGNYNAQRRAKVREHFRTHHPTAVVASELEKPGTATPP